MNVYLHTRKEAVGGFHSIEVIRVEDVINCPPILTNANASTFDYQQFQEEDVEISPVGETIIIKATPKATKNGQLYTIKGSFEAAYPNAEVDTIFTSYQLKKVIVKMNTNNGKSRIYGSVEHPLNFNYEIKDNKKFEKTSKFVVNISGKIPQKPVFIQG